MKFKIKKRYIIIIILIITIGALVWYKIRKPSIEEQYVTDKVIKGDLHQIVSATGAIIPPSEINLNNLITGKIAEMDVDIGDKVKKDQLLAKLDNKDLEIKVNEAAANVAAAQADFERLLQGSKNEDVAVSVANANKAEGDYKSALKTLEDIKRQAAQDISSAEDNLDNVKEKTEKDVKTSEKLVQSAETTLNTAKTTLTNTKNTKEQAIDNAKESALISVDTKLFVSSASLNVVYDIIDDDDIKTAVNNPTYIADTQVTYNMSVGKIASAREDLIKAQQSDEMEDIKQVLDEANDSLNSTFNCLLNCYTLVVNCITTDKLSKSDLDAYKASVKTEQTSMSTALTTIQSSKQTLDNAILDYASSLDAAQANIDAAERSLDEAKAKLELAVTTKDTQILAAQNSLEETKIAANKKINDASSSADSYYNQWKLMEKQVALKESDPLSSEINLYRSRVNQAQAALAAANENLEKSILKAPIDGVITKKNYEIGEQTNLSTPIYSMMVINNYEIEVSIPESDIVKIKLGQPVTATLDAYSDEVKFKGSVIFIEPAQTVIQDVVYYKVKIALDKTDYEIKSGMTANVDIETAKRENVLIIPQRAVLSNGEKKVRVLADGVIKDVVVETGIKGEEGLEILSGLKEGEKIVVYEKK